MTAAAYTLLSGKKISENRSTEAPLKAIPRFLSPVLPVIALLITSCRNDPIDPGDDDPTGREWIRAGADAPVALHQALTAFDGGSGTRLWITGGYSGDFDIWSSTDGNNWTATAPVTGVTATSEHVLFPFNAGSGLKLWMIGNQAVRSSTNGLEWTTTATNATAFQRGIDEFVYNGKMWAIAGASIGLTNAVWSSPDGVNWLMETAAAAFTPRWHYAGVVFKNKMWVIGGLTTNLNSFPPPAVNGASREIWSSTDGISWTLENANPAFAARGGHEVVEFAGKLWLLGGWDGTASYNYFNDVWRSDDGITWTLVIANAGFGRRAYHSCAVFDNRIWLYGGRHDDVVLRDLWSTR